MKDVLGLRHRGRSVGVERALSDFGNEESFGHASVRFAEHYGWEVDRTTVLRVVEQRARETEIYVQERLARAREDFDEPLATRPGALERTSFWRSWMAAKSVRELLCQLATASGRKCSSCRAGNELPHGATSGLDWLVLWPHLTSAPTWRR